jgi:hypothetical protein
MNPTDEQFLRKYLRKKIAEKNLEFAKMSSRFKESAKIYRMDVFTTFARGINGSNAATPSNLDLVSTREHIARTCNRMSPYNYFDLDTLIAYDAYWEAIQTQADDFRIKRNGQFFNQKDFDNAKYVVSKYFIANQLTPKTGYYNLYRPVRILRDENRRPVFEKTPDIADFDKKYSYYDCELLLADYLYERYSLATFANMEYEESEENNSTNIDEEEFSLTSFDYENRTYEIEQIKDYYSEKFEPIKFIVARSTDSEYLLSGFFDKEMFPYYGKVLDSEKNVVDPSSGLWLRYVGEREM